MAAEITATESRRQSSRADDAQADVGARDSGSRSLRSGEKRMLAVLGVPTFALALAITVVSSYLPVLAHTFTSSTLVIGVIVGAEGVMAMWIPLVVGTWSDHLRTPWGGRVPFLLAGTPVAVVALIAIGFVGSIAVMAGVVAVFFVGYFIAYEPYRALYPDSVSDEVAGRAQSTQALWRGVGTGVALLGGGLLISLGLPVPFLAGAGVLGVSMIGFFLTLARRGVPRPEKAEKVTVRAQVAELRRLLGERRLLRTFLLANGLWELSLSSLKTFIVLYLTRQLGYTTTEASVIIGITAVFILIAAALSGKLGDRYGEARVMKVVMPFYGLGLLVPLFFTSKWVLGGILPFVAMGGGFVMSLPYAIAQPLMPDAEHGAITGYYSLSRGIGTSLGPLFAGLAISDLGHWRPPDQSFQAMWGICAVAILLSIPLVRELDRGFEHQENVLALLRRDLQRAKGWAARRLAQPVGGAARLRVLVLLGCVLALNGADLGTIGAVAQPLERSLGIGNTELALLVSLPLLLGALATVPVGALTDRVPRVRLLAGSIVLWSAAMLASGSSVAFAMLLVSRLFLGAVLATSGPTLFSLTGDLFPAAQRARMWGFITAGELIGTGFGFIFSGALAAVSWRAPFFALAIPTLALAFALWRLLPEPARGGQSHIAEGDEEIVSLAQAHDRASKPQHDQAAEDETLAERAVAGQDVDARPGQILAADPERLSLWKAVRYVLQIRTNLVVIVASALGYFFLSGVQTFGLVFIRGQYTLSQTGATGVIAVLGIGGLAGVLISGRIADRLLGGGRLTARVIVPALGYTAAALLFIVPLITHLLALALPLLALAAAATAAPEPPLDAARLDVMPGRLWGRAEGVRTALRMLAMAAAPLVFALLAQQLGADSGSITSAQNDNSSGGAGAAQGLDYAFLVMLAVLAGAGLTLLLAARRTYPRDVATAMASDERIDTSI